MELGNKVAHGLIILGVALILVGAIGKIITFVISFCGGFNG